MVSTSNISANLRTDVNKVSQDNDSIDTSVIENPELLQEKQYDDEALLNQDREFINRELSKVPGMEQPFDLEEPEEIHENKFFKSLRNFLAPAIDNLNKGNIPVAISGLGGALHLLDSLVESQNLPEPVKKLSYNASIFYSKILTVLPNALKGIDSLAKNDFMDGFAKIYTLGAKMFQSKPANFSISSGFFPGVQMAKLAIGAEKYEAKNFKSFGENIKFFFSELLGSITKSASEISSGKNVLSNVLKILVPSGLMGSTVLGTALIGDEVSTPKAKTIGFFRNMSGIGGDFWLINEAYKEAKEKHGPKQAFAEMLKSDHFKIGFPYILVSIGELANRYTPEPVQDVLAQLFCGANETITALWGMVSNKEKEPEPEFA